MDFNKKKESESPPKFCLLILDRNKVPRNTNLQEILRHSSAEYCIILNTIHREIRSVYKRYWMSSSVIHIPRSCVVLSRKGDPPNLITPPASVSWDYIADNSPGLYITIQGIRILLAYLSPHDIRERLSLLHTLADEQYIDACIPDIHLLITYLDRKWGFHPRFKKSNNNWTHIQNIEGKDITSSSFHFFRNNRNHRVCQLENITRIFSGKEELPSAAGGITHVTIHEGWEIEHLYTHQALDHLHYRRTKP